MADQAPDSLQKEFLDALRKMIEKEKVIFPQADRVGEEKEEKRKFKKSESLRFDLKPKEVKKYLDRFVVQQEEAKRVLATTVCDHYQHVRTCSEKKKCKNYQKQNVVMLGPTGVGKTYLIRCLADLIGVPFVKADSTKFSETGYVGGDVEDLVRDLVHKADGDIELAECGMIYLDEVDKIATSSNIGGRDVSGAGVQRGLLKIMEETEVSLRNPQDVQSQFQAMMEFQQKGKVTKPVINTRHILFIVSGAFDRLPPIIEKRLKHSDIGFSAKPPRKIVSSKMLSEVQTEDLIRYGLESEFVGRLPVRVVCRPLTEEDLYRVLTMSEDSILRQYEASFNAYGIKLNFEETALWDIAKKSVMEGTGARGILTVCEKIFRDLKYELPSTLIKEFTLTSEMVARPQEALKAFLSDERKRERGAMVAEIRRFEADFFAKNNIRIEFDEAATESILSKVFEEGSSVYPFLERLLSNYNYGLGLIQKTKPQQKFILTETVVANPNIVLDQWIKESYEARS